MNESSASVPESVEPAPPNVLLDVLEFFAAACDDDHKTASRAGESFREKYGEDGVAAVVCRDALRSHIAELRARSSSETLEAVPAIPALNFDGVKELLANAAKRLKEHGEAPLNRHPGLCDCANVAARLLALSDELGVVLPRFVVLDAEVERLRARSASLPSSIPAPADPRIARDLREVREAKTILDAALTAHADRANDPLYLALLNAFRALPLVSESSVAMSSPKDSSTPAPERIAGFRDGYARALVVSTGTNPLSWDEGISEVEREATRYAATVLSPKDSETPEATPLTEAKKKTLREHPAIEAAWGKFAEQMPSGQISRLGLEAALSHLVSTYVNLAWAEEKAEVRAACDTGMRLNLPAAEIVARIRAAIRSASAPEGETPETQNG